MRAVFEAAVLREWARVEPDAMLAHLATLDANRQRSALLGGALNELSGADPRRVLETAAKLSPDLRGMLEQRALQTLALDDPLAAMRFVERLPSGMQREQLLQLVARSYGQKDPAGALAWARATPGQRNLTAAVISGIAAVDPDRALALANEVTAPMERMQSLQSVMSQAAMRSDADAAAMADKIIALGDQSARDGTWMRFLSMWSSRSPDGAMQWLLSNADRAPPDVFRNVGQQLGSRDPANAVTHTSRIPAAAREAWIQGVAAGYAESDALAAVDWLGQFRGEPLYARTVVAVAGVVAQRDGAAAARLLDSVAGEVDARQSMNIATVIANNWANSDPAAAAEWALVRAEPQARSMAVANVIDVWATTDLDAARPWVLRLPEGQLRDLSLTRLLTAAGTRGGGEQGMLDAGVLSSFSGDRARQQAVLQVAGRVAQGDRWKRGAWSTTT